MPDDAARLSPELQAALAALGAVSWRTVHLLQVGLAELVLEQAPAIAASQLALARAFIEGQLAAWELNEARQDCWTYVGSLACGCSAADSASAHCILTCLETDDAAHTPAVLSEQVARVLRCGVAEAHVVRVLQSG
jgi:hypothetical protein